jgi:hypothetical protein
MRLGMITLVSGKALETPPRMLPAFKKDNHMKSLRYLTRAFGLLALALGPVPALLVHATGLDAAYADSSNGKGNGNGGNSGNAGGNGNGGTNSNGGGTNNSAKTAGSSNGALASELKGMNAVHANPNALKNADPNSQVGKIAAYQNAALATQAAELAVETATSNLVAAQEGLAAAEALPASTPEEITARDTAIAAANQAIADATTAVGTANADLELAAATEDAALLTATGGETLSVEALAYIRAELGL